MLTLSIEEWKLAQRIGATCYVSGRVTEFLKEDGGRWYRWLLVRHRGELSDGEWTLVERPDLSRAILIESREQKKKYLYNLIVAKVVEEGFRVGFPKDANFEKFLNPDILDVIDRYLEVE